jgi:glycosyltransferase involved in cell wall biosynthesis
MSEPLISVVIPARNAASTLEEQLQALSTQVGEAQVEVIVADNGSADATRSVAESFRDRLDLRVIDASARPGAAHARNVGAAAARGRFLAFVDADDVVGPGWLQAVMDGLERHPFIACRYDTASLNPPEVAASLGHAQRDGLMTYDYPPYLPHAGGGGLAIRREHHQAIGGFDESYPALEDTDYCWRLQLAGVPLTFLNDAVVRIRLKAGAAALFRQGVHFGRYNVRIYRRYRDRGMPYLGPLPGLLRWIKLLGRLPLAVWKPGDRARWLWQLGWRCGRVRGCFTERVLAL